MRNQLTALLLICLPGLLPAHASGEAIFEQDYLVALESSLLDGVSLGDDPAADRLRESSAELEFNLGYQLDEHWFLFLDGSLISESIRLDNSGEGESSSGLERRQMGASLSFGEAIPSELSLGRVEFSNTSKNWVWWDDELDAIRLNSSFSNLELMLAVAEEQFREASYEDFIDPEQERVRRLLASLSWEFSSEQLLQFFLLDQDDHSAAYAIADNLESGRVDASDADLRWSGISYLGEFQQQRLGALSLELHYSRLSGNETLYQFSNPTSASSTVDSIQSNRVEASASGVSLNWKPAGLDNWSLLLLAARASGDGNPGDNRSSQFRQTGLQGDSDPYGALLQPELSNLRVNGYGFAYSGFENIDIQLVAYDYRQHRLDTSTGALSLDLASSGLHSDLGREIDLSIDIRTSQGVSIEIVAASFEAGRAYAESRGNSSQFLFVGLEYQF